MSKKLIGIIISVAIAAGLMSSIAWADETWLDGELLSDNELSADSSAVALTYNGYPVYRGTAYYWPESGNGRQLVTTFYSDGYFAEDASIYNSHLATLSEIGATSASELVPTNVNIFLNNIGAVDITLYNFNENTSFTSCGVAIATKKLFEGTDHEETLVIAIARGGAYGEEFQSAYTIGASGETTGTSGAADNVYAGIQSYLQEQGLAASDVKFWLTGYSRGGAIVNLVSKRLSDSVGTQNVFAYTVESYGAGDMSVANAKAGYPNIHNLTVSCDGAVYMMPSLYGLGRYGVDHLMGDMTSATFAAQEAAMLRQYNLINPHATASENGYLSPSTFVWKKLNIESVLTGGGDISNPETLYSDPSSSYAKSLVEWASCFNSRLSSVASTRSAYATEIPSDVASAASAMKIAPMTCDEAVSTFIYMYTKGNPAAFQELTAQLTNMAKSNTVLMANLYLYISSRSTFLYSYSDICTKLWNVLEKGGSSYKSLSACGFSAEEIASYKRTLPTLLYFLAYFYSTDNAQDQQALATYLYNSSLLSAQHWSCTSLAWARYEDSYYANEIMKPLSGALTETTISVGDGGFGSDTLAGTVVTVKNASGTTIATVVDGALTDSTKTSYTSGAVYLSGTDSELSVWTPANGAYTVSVTAPNATDENLKTVTVTRRAVNTQSAGVVSDVNGNKKASVTVHLNGSQEASAAVGTSETKVSRLQDGSPVTFNLAMSDQSLTYTGKPLSLALDGDLPVGAQVDYVGNAQTDAGTYTVTAKVSGNLDDFYLPNGTEVSAKLTITQADNSLSNLQATGWTYGAYNPAVNTPIYTAAFGTATFTYASTADGTYTSTRPEDVGTWWVKATIAETANYASASAVTSFTITKSTNALTDLALEGWGYGATPNTPTYKATAGTPTFTYSNSATGTFTSDVPTARGTWWVKATIAETENFDGAACDPVSFTIGMGTYDMSKVTFADETIDFDGGPHSLTIKGELPAGVSVASYDGNGQTAVGDYTITVHFAAEDTVNYYPVADMTATMSIKDLANYINDLSITGWTYGQAAHTPSATSRFGTPTFTYSTSENGTYTATVPTSAGTYWVKAYVPATDTYHAAEAKASFTIAKATYNMAGVRFADASVTYDAHAHSLAIDGTLPAGVSVSYTGNAQIGVGTYMVTASFTGDTKNYNAIADMQATLSISFNMSDTFRIVSAVDRSLMLDVAGANPKSGANVSIWTNNQGLNQQFTLQKVAGTDNRYVLVNAKNTKLVLDAAGVSPKDGANVSTWTNNGASALNQQWILEPVEGLDNGFVFRCAANENLVLTASGAGAGTAGSSGAAPVSGSNVVVASACQDSGSWTLVGATAAVAAQIWQIVPAYDISYADVTAVGMVKNAYDGANLAPALTVTLNGKTLTEGRDYAIYYDGDTTTPTTPGEYEVTIQGTGSYISTKTVGVLKVVGADVVTRSAMRLVSAADAGYVLDVAGASPVRGSNVSVWVNNQGLNQQFTIETTGDGFYLLRNVKNTSLVLDAAGVNPVSGSNVSTWSYNGGINQKWVLVAASTEGGSGYKFVSAANPELVLSSDGSAPEKGANVAIATDNNGANQIWKFVSAQDLAYADVSATGFVRNYYDGAVAAPTINVSLNGRTLVAGSDFDVLYDGSTVAPAAVGRYEVSIVGKGNYTGAAEVGTLELVDAGIEADATIRLVNSANKNLALSCADTNPLLRSNVNVKTVSQDASQQFSFVETGKGTYILKNAKNTNLVLTATMSSSGSASASTLSAGANVNLMNNTRAANQQWVVVPQYDGSLVIVSSADDSLVLAVAAEAPSNGTNVELALSDLALSELTLSDLALSDLALIPASQRWLIYDAHDISMANVTATGMTKNIIDGVVSAPSVTLTLAGKTLKADTDYVVTYNGSASLPTAEGEYQVAVVGKGGFEGSLPIGVLRLYDLPVDTGESYHVVSCANSDFVLDVAGVTPVSGANVSIWTNNGGQNQLFRFEKTADGYVVLKNVANRTLVLDAAGATPKIGANVSTWILNNGINQKWVLIPQENGGYAIASAANIDFVLDAAGATPKIGANVSIWTNNGGKNQTWLFVKE